MHLSSYPCLKVTLVPIPQWPGQEESSPFAMASFAGKEQRREGAKPVLNKNAEDTGGGGEIVRRDS